MTNENNNTSSIKETGLNRKVFEEIIENTNLSSEDKKKIGEFKEFKNDTVGEVLKVEDKDKITAYEELKVKDLPKDWEFKLARIKEQEKKTFDYDQKTAELKGWTDIFREKKPQEVQEEIKKLEEEYSEFKKKSEAEIQELTKKYERADQELKGWQQDFPQQTSLKVKEKVQELEQNLSEWIQNWGNKELVEVQAEWEELQKRPDIPITKDQFWDDYAERKTIPQSKLESEELAKEREKVKEFQEKNGKLWFTINNFLKNERIRRFASSKPVLTIKDAREAISELLEKTEKYWGSYLEGNITDENFILDLSLFKKEKQVRQTLEWIKEARTTLDYETLFERWSGSKKYDEENDFDGSLYLLSKWLEVKEFEALATE